VARVAVEQLEFPERRRLVAPVPTAVERPVVPAVVEPDPGIVLGHDHLAVVEGVDCERLLRLGAQRAVLNDPDIDLAVSGELVLAALGARDLDPVAAISGTLCTAAKGSGPVE